MAEALPAYEIEAEIGRGGWSVVYAGRHLRLGRKVAIKQLVAGSSDDTVLRARFLAEAQVIASLDHPHIVPVFDYVERDGLYVIVMEYLEGGTVAHRFARQGIRTDEAVAIVIAMCAGLQFAHDRGILHRDVKPENVIFSGQGVPKITDFGIAKLLGEAQASLTVTGTVMATPSYIAPERALGKELTAASDVYSAGVVLYELLSGRLPFGGHGDAVAQLYQHVHERPDALSHAAPFVPRAVARVVERALAKSLGERFASAGQFGMELTEAATESWGAGWLRRTGIRVVEPAMVAATERSTRRRFRGRGEVRVVSPQAPRRGRLEAAVPVEAAPGAQSPGAASTRDLEVAEEPASTRPLTVGTDMVAAASLEAGPTETVEAPTPTDLLPVEASDASPASGEAIPTETVQAPTPTAVLHEAEEAPDAPAPSLVPASLPPSTNLPIEVARSESLAVETEAEASPATETVGADAEATAPPGSLGAAAARTSETLDIDIQPGAAIATPSAEVRPIPGGRPEPTRRGETPQGWSLSAFLLVAAGALAVLSVLIPWWRDRDAEVDVAPLALGLDEQAWTLVGWGILAVGAFLIVTGVLTAASPDRGRRSLGPLAGLGLLGLAVVALFLRPADATPFPLGWSVAVAAGGLGLLSAAAADRRIGASAGLLSLGGLVAAGSALVPWWKITWAPKLIPAIAPNTLYVGHRLEVDPTWIGSAVLAIGAVSLVGGLLLAFRTSLGSAGWIRVAMVVVGIALVVIAVYGAARGNTLVNDTVIPYAGTGLAALAGAIMLFGGTIRSESPSPRPSG